MIINPLRYYKEHVKMLSDYLSTIKLDKFLCTTNISYSVTLKVFEQTRFFLYRKIYYNIRSRTVSTEQNEFTGFIIVLEKTRFIFKCRIEKEIDLETCN